MGLLDDAIREHLALKRRRGADPAEVERAEREALGPVRRGPEEPEDDELSQDPGADREPAYDHEEEEDWGGEPFEDEPEASKKKARKFFSRRARPDPDSESPDEPLDAPEPSSWQEPPTSAEPSTSDESSAGHPPPAPQEPPASREPRGPAVAGSDPPAAPSPHPAGGAAGGETVEYDVEDALHANKAEDAEDVLEETPEFLQDTPDHDRLWFEQRPPRDFDFDG